MDECLLRLGRADVGRLGFVHDGEPDVLPVNFRLDGSSPVFRSTWGSKLYRASAEGLVALEVDDVDEETKQAWSVVLKGRAVLEYDDEAVARYETLGVPAWLGDDTETFWVRVVPDSVTGRELDLP